MLIILIFVKDFQEALSNVYSFLARSSLLWSVIRKDKSRVKLSTRALSTH